MGVTAGTRTSGEPSATGSGYSAGSGGSCRARRMARVAMRSSVALPLERSISTSVMRRRAGWRTSRSWCRATAGGSPRRSGSALHRDRGTADSRSWRRRGGPPVAAGARREPGVEALAAGLGDGLALAHLLAGGRRAPRGGLAGAARPSAAALWAAPSLESPSSARPSPGPLRRPEAPAGDGPPAAPPACTAARPFGDAAAVLRSLGPGEADRHDRSRVSAGSVPIQFDGISSSAANRTTCAADRPGEHPPGVVVDDHSPGEYLTDAVHDRYRASPVDAGGRVTMPTRSTPPAFSRSMTSMTSCSCTPPSPRRNSSRSVLCASPDASVRPGRRAEPLRRPRIHALVLTVAERHRDIHRLGHRSAVRPRATGRFTSTPRCSIGAATMKMMSSTSITSTSGMTLISASVEVTRRPRRAAAAGGRR